MAHRRYMKRRPAIIIRMREQGFKKRAENKLLVLTHYGKDGRAQCCWEDCGIVDPDMLSIDHINNDGNHHRNELMGNPRQAGAPFYRRLIREDYPEGFQTLCYNHQFKKELLRKRAARSDNGTK